MFYGALVLTLGIVGYLWWRLETARRAEAWEESQREGYRRRIAADPKNIGAHEALGDSLHRAGRLDDAREAYLAALEAGSDDRVADRTRYKLQQLDRDVRLRAQAKGRRGPRPEPEMVFCHLCGAPNAPQRRRCDSCDAQLPFHSFREAFTNREVQRASLEGLCILLVLLLLLRVFEFFPLEIKGVVSIATIAVAAWRCLRAIEGRRG